ncbi:Wilms tumor protein 1-interacting protein homolog [Gastrophryne carolinensis]
MERYQEELSVQASRLMEELCLEEAMCHPEVALPCYTGDRGKRYSAELYRAGYEGGKNGLYPGGKCSPRSSLASSSASPRSSVSSAALSPRSSLVVPGVCGGGSPRSSLGQYEGSALSPRSSYASTASDTSKHSSPRASLSGQPSSNRTSGISMGYDQRHVSPRSSMAGQYSGSPRSSMAAGQYSTSPRSSSYYVPASDITDGVTSPRSSVCLQDGRSATLGNPSSSVVSPRSSISSHSSRSSRSSRGSLGAYSDLPVPSPRSSMLGPSVQEESPDPASESCHYKLLAHSPPQTSNNDVSYNFSLAKGSATVHRFKVPYQVTPSKESGPSQAEKRLEALTLELEKELEMHMKKEYFGICIKCGKGVYGASQACQAMGNLFHTNCFTCCSCGRRLRGKAFYNVNGKVYCEEDFLYSGFQQTADKCFVCGHLIMEMILQALGKSYHPGCFRCVVCNECLDGVPFTVDVENNIYCVKDYHTVFAPKCASCHQPILPAQGSEETIRVVSMDKDYHVECYHCEDCHLQLNDEEGHRCYPLDGHLLCHSCHIRRLSVAMPSPHASSGYPMHVTEL